MRGTITALTLAMRWMPPNTMTSAITASPMPTHRGSHPKASWAAPQMVLLWMEL